MVIGLFPSANHAAVCLSNLAEAEFPNRDISVVAQGAYSANELARVTGPLQGLSADDLGRRLRALGLAPAAADVYVEGVRRGEVFLAVSAEGADEAAAEILQDHGAENIQEVGKA